VAARGAGFGRRLKPVLACNRAAPVAAGPHEEAVKFAYIDIIEGSLCRGAAVPTVAELDLWPFLSIVAWPDGYEREQVVQLLAAFRGLDEETLRMRLGQRPPAVWPLERHRARKMNPSPCPAVRLPL
jgi:hypothetical protein